MAQTVGARLPGCLTDLHGFRPVLLLALAGIQGGFLLLGDGGLRENWLNRQMSHHLIVSIWQVVRDLTQAQSFTFYSNSQSLFHLTTQFIGLT
jgi:hypothetical protein